MCTWRVLLPPWGSAGERFFLFLRWLGAGWAQRRCDASSARVGLHRRHTTAVHAPVFDSCLGKGVGGGGGTRSGTHDECMRTMVVQPCARHRECLTMC